MKATSPPPSNAIVTALQGKDRHRILHAAVPVTLRGGSILFDRGDRVRHLHFPIRGFVSMLASSGDHATVEVAMVGSEGVCGYSEVLGGDVSPLRAFLIEDCHALRINSTTALRIVEDSSKTTSVMSRYVSVRMAQLAQTVACTRFHVVEQRLARWLLMAHDRAHADTLAITQDELSHLLGVRRVGISAAAAAFKTRGLIHYARGSLTIIDRMALETESCMCYRADLATYNRGMQPQAR